MNILKDIITYAFRGSGKYVLITCSVLSVVSDIASFAPFLGLFAWLLLSGYFCAIYFQLIQSSATGGEEAPAFPDTSSIVEDIIGPMLQIFVALLVSFTPLIAYLFWSVENDGDSLIEYGLVGLGIIYFPMAMLAVVVLGYTRAVSPHIVIPAIFRGGWIYWVGVIMIILLYFVSEIIEEALAGRPILGTLVMAVVGTYTMMTNARILGVVYRERQHEFGWV